VLRRVDAALHLDEHPLRVALHREVDRVDRGREVREGLAHLDERVRLDAERVRRRPVVATISVSSLGCSPPTSIPM
jgi:hypothetical protein